MPTSGLNPAKSDIVAKLDLSTPIALFQSALVAKLDRSNSTFIHPFHLHGVGKY